ncbi:MAG: TonB-dependent receptor [Planctomycetota bacterium]
MRYLIILCICISPAMLFAQQINQSAGAKSGYFNPDISVIIDSAYHQTGSRKDVTNVLGRIKGFGSNGADEEGIQDGINLRESELVLSSNIDPYFSGYLITSLSPEGASVEEAVIQATDLSYGFEIKGGKMFSNFGRINSQHGHSWDFIDRPLIYQLTLGEEGLNDVCIQTSYLAPTSFYLLSGIEVFQGNGEKAFAYSGESPLPERSGPRLMVGWLKVAPNLPDKHSAQFGVSFGRGVQQETQDGNSDGTIDNWLDGYGQFWGADFVYKFNSNQAYGQGKLVFQGEYFNLQKNLIVKEDDLNPALVSEHDIDRQDGYYFQATYGILPRWQTGLRWEQIGLINNNRLPDGTSESFGSSNKTSLAFTYRPSEFSFLRLQFSNGNYRTSRGNENVSEVYLQFQVSLGKHGAHKF